MKKPALAWEVSRHKTYGQLPPGRTLTRFSQDKKEERGGVKVGLSEWAVFPEIVLKRCATHLQKQTNHERRHRRRTPDSVARNVCGCQSGVFDFALRVPCLICGVSVSCASLLRPDCSCVLVSGAVLSWRSSQDVCSGLVDFGRIIRLWSDLFS